MRNFLRALLPWLLLTIFLAGVTRLNQALGWVVWGAAVAFVGVRLVSYLRVVPKGGEDE